MSYNKTLTISVAAYNASETIRQCLDSCLKSDVKEMLEIIVINDGSTDSTAQIVEQYVLDYPSVVKLINKTNGGYGSTVNASLAIAQGYYYRLLDSDDWVDSDGLSNLVRNLKAVDVDLAIAPFVERTDTESNIIDQADFSVEGKVAFEGDIVAGHLSMHSICYRTELLRKLNYQLPEHRLYTDTLYNVIPLQLVKSALVTHEPVYQYRVGRIGQSVSSSNLAAHYQDFYLMVCELFFFWQNLENKDSLSARILKSWLVGDAIWLVHILCDMDIVPVEQLFEIMDTLAQDTEIYENCMATSLAFRLLAKMPRLLFPAFITAYRIYHRKETE